MVRRLQAHDGQRERDQQLKNLVHQRLLDRTEVDAVTGCWIYTGYWDEHGNARIRVGERPYTVQRASAWVYYDRPPFDIDGPELVVHECETPACWNPEHLKRCGCRADAAELLRKLGRRLSRRLNQETADRMRVQASTMSRTALSVENHVGHGAVRAVLRGEAWAPIA
jgi:hypothetical protein